MAYWVVSSGGRCLGVRWRVRLLLVVLVIASSCGNRQDNADDAYDATLDLIANPEAHFITGVKPLRERAEILRNTDPTAPYLHFQILQKGWPSHGIPIEESVLATHNSLIAAGLVITEEYDCAYEGTFMSVYRTVDNSTGPTLMIGQGLLSPPMHVHVAFPGQTIDVFEDLVCTTET